ncbi:hypothetical protein [Mesorhizobium sp. M0715]|uniref:hypothetical protein n=1 Tax=Mesorhizobium sp. M0715 TaxID=2956990 RepID=UPI0033385E03
MHVTFIHGLSNKPAADALLNIWRRALASGMDGLDLGAEGVTSTLVYWADILYEAPDPDVSAYENARELIPSDVDAAVNTLAPLSGSPAEAAFITGLAVKTGGLLAAAEAVEAIPEDRNLTGVALERIPLPWSLKAKFMETYLRDAHHYLFNKVHTPRPGVSYKVQDAVRARLIDGLRASTNAETHIVVAHSLGSVIAYDCLMRVAECPQISGLITVGGPLGLDEIQDRMAPEWSRVDGFPSKITGRWVNVFDRLDPVSGFDPFIANDFYRNGRRAVEDIAVRNDGAWRHSITKYLRQSELRTALSSMLQLS